MNNSQDIPSRRVYVVRATKELIARVTELGDPDLLQVIARPEVVMTQELPFEEYIEGWRTKILENCKIAFLQELMIEYPIMDKNAAKTLFGNTEPSIELFDKWWMAEEAEYTEIPTNWNE